MRDLGGSSLASLPKTTAPRCPVLAPLAVPAIRAEVKADASRVRVEITSDELAAAEEVWTRTCASPMFEVALNERALLAPLRAPGTGYPRGP